MKRLRSNAVPRTPPPVPTPKLRGDVPEDWPVLRHIATGWIVFKFMPGPDSATTHMLHPMFWQGPAANAWMAVAAIGEVPLGAAVFASAEDARAARDAAAERRAQMTEQAGLFA